MKAVVTLAVIAAALPASFGQQSSPQQQPLLPTQQANQLFERTIQLMESAAIAIPDLNRAGAPIAENARQAFTLLRQRPGSLSATHTLVTNARAFVLLADSVSKPFPFPEQAATQLAELRNSLSRLESHFAALLLDRETALRSPDRDNLKRYAEANARISPPQPNKPRVVFLGDSITDGWHLNQYFPDQDFVNRGISGQITGEMLGRFKSDVIDLKPKAVLVLAGTNDLARGVPVLAIENNYQMMADLADKHGIKIIFTSVLPVSDYHKNQDPSYERTPGRPPQLIRTLNDWLRAFCQQRGYTYVDYFSAMADANGMLRTDLADDGLHPNAAGYRIMGPLALGGIQRSGALGESPQQKSGRSRRNKKES